MINRRENYSQKGLESYMGQVAKALLFE